MTDRSDGGDDRPSPEEVAERFARFRETGDRALRNELIEEHRWIAVHCARRFLNRGEPLDDLVQVGQVGLLKAVQRFDPAMGFSFTTFAMPTVLGEIRRYFRDATWAVKVPRRLKDLHVAVGAAVAALSTDLGRPPRPEELAEHLDIDVDAVLEALEAGRGYKPSSLAPPPGVDRSDDESTVLRVDDVALGSVDDRVLVERLLATLPEREQEIVRLRFFGELSQSEIAERVGVSQVHVSRLLRSSLASLQRQLDRPDRVG